MALEKAYTKINDLSKEAMKAATGSDDLSGIWQRDFVLSQFNFIL